MQKVRSLICAMGESLSNALTGEALRHFCIPVSSPADLSPLIHRHMSSMREVGRVIPDEKWISSPTLIILEDCRFPLAAHTMGCVINADSIKLMFHSHGDKQWHPVPAQDNSVTIWQQTSTLPVTG